MAPSTQTASQTIAEVAAWRPALEPMLRAFEDLLSAREKLVLELSESLKASGLALPKPQNERIQQGASLLSGASFTGTTEPLRKAAEKLLPLLAKIEVLAPHMPAITDYFLKPVEEADKREALVEAVASDNHTAIERIAKENALEPQVLEFVSDFVVSALLRAMAALALPEEGEAFWDEGDAWRQGYCPVCGALPSIGWLDKPVVDEKNAYLAGGGGKRHLHCGRCGANWKFRRGACPSCGEDENGTVEMLRESGIAHGERLDWCTKCKTYCPTVDLREREFVPNMDAAAFGMMHLDMVAARKKLRPLRPSFWNMF